MADVFAIRYIYVILSFVALIKVFAFRGIRWSERFFIIVTIIVLLVTKIVTPIR